MPEIAPEILIEWRRFEQLSAPDLYDILRFRQDIFVVQQGSPYPDLDGLDRSALHLLLRADGVLAGYLRLLPPPDAASAVRLGRVAVIAGLRRRGLGRELLTQALICCRKLYAGHGIALSAQLHLVPFYENLGFAAIAVPFDDFGIAHVEMEMPKLPDTSEPLQLVEPFNPAGGNGSS